MASAGTVGLNGTVGLAVIFIVGAMSPIDSEYPVSGPNSESAQPIETRQQLIDYLASGVREPAQWAIGTEHEKFGFHLDTLRPLAYREADGTGIEAILQGLTQFGWEPVTENGHLIALSRDGASVSLEPAGQLELSGAPLKDLHDTHCEVAQHLQEVRTVAEPMGIGFLGMGFQPKWKREDMPWMPKGRYKIMREYMPKVGSLGLDMMTRTCTVQVNLDVGSEADMIRKFRVSLALQSVATAMFADSPFTEGQPNGFRSYRSHIWTDTDPDRTGLLDFVFDEGFGYERYVDYLLDVPMYFVYRDGRYIDASGQSFRDFLDGRLPAYMGQRPSIKDWADHSTTAFPEVRLKKYLEMRGADSGPWNRITALPALFVGLLYDTTALDAAWDLVKDWSIVELHALRDGVPKHGLSLPFRNGTVLDIARQVLAIANNGLRARARTDANGLDESIYLEPLIEFAEAGISPADRKLQRFHGEWGGNIDRVFEEYRYR